MLSFSKQETAVGLTLVGTAQARGDLRHCVGVVNGVEEPYFVFLSFIGQTGLSVLADRLEESEARKASLLDRHHERLVHQLIEQTEDIGGVSDVLSSREIEPAGEDRKTSEKRRLFLAEQVVGPADRVLEGSLPAHRRLRGCGEDPERRLELVGEVEEGESADPCRGQLDAERNPVETTADPGDGFQVGVRRGEIRLHPGGPVEEETHRLRSRQVRSLSGQAKRRDPEHDLGGGPERLP